MGLLMPALVCLTVMANGLNSRDVNVAAKEWGTKATASSSFGGTYTPDRALDGRWASRETDKWNTESGTGPHWIVIDFTQPRKIHRIVIRHEGVVGEGDAYNTRDFRLQRADSPDGPWIDLVPPIVGNTASITEHNFKPVSTRYVRMFVTKGEKSGNEFARIFEIEVYADASTITDPLLTVAATRRFRNVAGVTEQALSITAWLPGGREKGASLNVLEKNIPLPPPDIYGRRTVWIPVPASSALTECELICPDGKHALVNLDLHPLDQLVGATEFPPFFANGEIDLVASSHQDIAWMNTPQRCIEQRDREVITPALDKMKSDPGFHFVMEDTLSLMEYLERHPERLDEIIARTKEGRFEWGATYNEPYESLQSSESLVRQLYYGRRWLKKTLPGCDARTAWSPDVPGRAMQMMQILKKGGVDYLVMSRQSAGLYDWRSPDGTGVIAYSPGHYVDSWSKLTSSFTKSAPTVVAELEKWVPYYRDHKLPPDYCFLISTDAASPQDFAQLRGDWPEMTGDGDKDWPSIPRLRSCTSAEFLDKIAAAKPELPVIVGERPNVWLYIHGPTHHQAISAMREAAVLLPAAELFSTADAVSSGCFANYPTQELAEAWKRQIYPDHGWGGYYGEITDGIFLDKEIKARDAGRKLVLKAIQSIASKVQLTKRGATPLVLFNALSWVRSDPVQVDLSFKPNQATELTVADNAGHLATHQLVACKRYSNGCLKTARIVFIAENLPSMGYSTWYVHPVRTRKTIASVPSASGNMTFTNSFYKITLAPGGVKSIYDKQAGCELLETSKFLAGELFTMQSVGNGAGEFAEVQQPTMEEFDKISHYSPEWRVVENGPVRTVFEMRMEPSEAKFRHTAVVQRIVAWRSVKRIDFETELNGWDGTPWREFRLAFPLNMEMSRSRVAYDAPMGVVEVGKSEIAGAAGERYVQPCSQVHPREVQNWFFAGNDRVGVTISSSVAVFDWVDPTTNPAGNIMLQPILLASRKSCHGLGNYYLQAGDHRYSFSLTSHKGGWEEGFHTACQANNSILAVMDPVATSKPILPTKMSFCSVNVPNVLISAVKRSEDDNSVAVRGYNITGSETDAKVNWFSKLVRVNRTNIIEEDAKRLPAKSNEVSVRFGPYSIETLKFELAGASSLLKR